MQHSVGIYFAVFVHCHAEICLLVMYVAVPIYIVQFIETKVWNKIKSPTNTVLQQIWVCVANIAIHELRHVQQSTTWPTARI
jgi:hypothetical protein